MYLKTISLTPPGGWTYTQPESDYTMVASTFSTLVQRVAAHRYNMGYVTQGDLAQELEEYTCARLSPQDQLEYCKSGIKRRNRVRFERVVSFLKTVATWLLVSRELVPQEEAERRGKICSECPLNVGIGGCGMCKRTIDGLRASLLQRSTNYDEKLKACGVCGCDNQAQVHIPLSTLSAGTPHTYPSFCWKSSLNSCK